MAEASHSEAEQPARGSLEKALGVFTELRRGESLPALCMLLAIFSLLVGYYVLKALREPLILASAEEDMLLLQSWRIPQWLKDVLSMQRGPQLRAAAAAGQALVLMAFVPLFAWVASRLARASLVLAVTAFFFANIGLFYLAMQLHLPFTGFVFFIWVGVFSVAMIALFWSFANDIYTEEAGKRLFPFIGIGATLGAPIGSLVAERLFAAEQDPALIILVTAVALCFFLALIALVHRRTPKPSQRPPEPSDRGLRGGFTLVLHSPYLRLLALLILLLNLVNTTGEYIFSEYAVDAAKAQVAADPSLSLGATIGALYASYYFWVNIVTFVLQAVVVSRVVKVAGVRGLVLALPLVALGVYALAAGGVAFAVMRWAKTAENATDYSLMNTAKAMLWLRTSREEKYKAKQAIDTFFVRFGDFLSGIVVIVGSTFLGLGVQGIAAFNVLMVLVWLGVTYWLFRALGACSA